MSPRIAHRLARISGVAPCSRCPGVVDVRAGHWIAAEPDGPHAICDRCAERDDPAGWTQLRGWRRAARPTTGRRWAS